MENEPQGIRRSEKGTIVLSCRTCTGPFVHTLTGKRTHFKHATVEKKTPKFSNGWENWGTLRPSNPFFWTKAFVIRHWQSAKPPDYYPLMRVWPLVQAIIMVHNGSQDFITPRLPIALQSCGDIYNVHEQWVSVWFRIRESGCWGKFRHTPQWTLAFIWLFEDTFFSENTS